MGTLYSTPAVESDLIDDVIEEDLTTNTEATPVKKRKYEEADEIEAEACSDEQFATPRKKMKSTSDYIYQTLYVNGENSDITINALGESWHLHKIYLCQSPYFRSMFKGDWAEKEKTEVEIDLPDEMITVEALNIAFGSLYSYEVNTIELNKNLVEVLAASRMFQLDGLLVHCEESMLQLISAETVCQFHQAAKRYGLEVVQEKCLNWLERNLLLCRTSVLAKDLSKPLLLELLSSPNFVVMQVEMDIYNFLKIWLYFQLHPNCNFTLKKLVIETQKYFQQEKKLNRITKFLETSEGVPYADIFKTLRLKYMLGDLKCIKLLAKDSIIPKEWLLPLYEKQWQKMLTVYTGDDTGPQNTLTDVVFEKNACRYGRTLVSDTRYCWRWTGFSYGIDIIVTYNNRTKTLSIKRNTFSQPCSFAVCLQSQRSVTVKFKAFNLDEKGQEHLCKDTGLVNWNFRTDEEIQLITFDDTWEFPVYISARILLASIDPS